MYKKIIVGTIVGVLGMISIVGAETEKVLICHGTSSETNPVVLISVSINALDTFLGNGDSILQVDADDCSEDPVPE